MIREIREKEGCQSASTTNGGVTKPIGSRRDHDRKSLLFVRSISRRLLYVTVTRGRFETPTFRLASPPTNTGSESTTSMTGFRRVARNAYSDAFTFRVFIFEPLSSKFLLLAANRKPVLIARDRRSDDARLRVSTVSPGRSVLIARQFAALSARPKKETVTINRRFG